MCDIRMPSSDFEVLPVVAQSEASVSYHFNNADMIIVSDIAWKTESLGLLEFSHIIA